jgi:hypothetical protein
MSAYAPGEMSHTAKSCLEPVGGLCETTSLHSFNGGADDCCRSIAYESGSRLGVRLGRMGLGRSNGRAGTRWDRFRLCPEHLLCALRLCLPDLCLWLWDRLQLSGIWRLQIRRISPGPPHLGRRCGRPASTALLSRLERRRFSVSPTLAPVLEKLFPNTEWCVYSRNTLTRSNCSTITASLMSPPRVRCRRSA